jgi:hypothetical protein
MMHGQRNIKLKKIILLIVSMITINVINMVGVPWGTKCSNTWLIFLIHPNNINHIHRDKARVSVSLSETCRVLYLDKAAK